MKNEFKHIFTRNFQVRAHFATKTKCNQYGLLVQTVYLAVNQKQLHGIGILHLEQNPQVTRRFPDTSKSDKVPVCASRTCSHLRDEGSLSRTCPVNEKAHWLTDNN